MRPRQFVVRWLLTITAATSLALANPAPSAALNPLKPICGIAGAISGVAGKVCGVAQHPGRLINAGKKLAQGHLGGAFNALTGSGGGSSTATTTALGLAAVGAWVLGGARFALHTTANVLGETTTPQLRSTWFSSAYWRVAAIAAVLTLPFLFAAAIQALIRSDLALLARAAFGYLPLAFLAVSVAAPIAMLLLAASDEMSAAVASAGGQGGTHFLVLAGAGAGLLSLLHGSPFLAFLVALFTAAGAVVLWVELLARAAAVYVVVLMLPLAFAAFVWPARRIWAIRAVELLVALILSKFAIVAVLALGGAALGHHGGVTGMLAGFVLIILGIFAPWAMVRLLPLAELASTAAGSFRGHFGAGRQQFELAADEAEYLTDWATALTGRLRQHTLTIGGGTQEAASAEAERTNDLDDRGPGRAGDSEPSPVPDTSAASPDGLDTTPEGPAHTPAEGTPAPASASANPEERLPGMEPMWQAPDMSWRPLTLGLDENGLPPRVWPPGDSPAPDPSDEPTADNTQTRPIEDGDL